MKKGILFLLLLSFLAPGRANALPAYLEVRNGYVKSDSLLLDRRGEILHELRIDPSSRRLDWTPLKNMSPPLREAVIRAEDKRFYDHRGIDISSLAGAFWRGLTTGHVRGASTITMQVASLLERESRTRTGRKSLWQKVSQAEAALEIERTWSKEEILEAYLNLVSFYKDLQGIAAASRALFGKDPHGLSRSDSLVLASLIRAPGASPERVIARAAALGRSLLWEVNEEEIACTVRQTFLGSNYVPPRAAFAAHVARRILKAHAGGSAVRCTLDGEIQRLALESLKNHLAPLRRQNVFDGAVLVVENRTGEVWGYVSYSGDPAKTRFVNCVQARRQAGSTLKPFLYALAFDARILTPTTLIDDSPVDIPVFGGIYRPRNYDNRFRGAVAARVALASSLNVPAVRTLSFVGGEAFLKRLRNLGFDELKEDADFYGPSLALGSIDVSLWNLVNAYRTLANGGARDELHLNLEEPPSPPRRVFSREAAFLVGDILSDREARSETFGLENPLAGRFWAAVKTGTSKDMRDNWCVGYSQRYTVGVWVGNISGEPMWNVSGVTGAAPVWFEIMNRLHREDEKPCPQPPAGAVHEKRGPNAADFRNGKESQVPGTGYPATRIAGAPAIGKITYPAPGTVIALDPDIPADRQKVFFHTRPGEGFWQWALDGIPLGISGRPLAWSPRPGQHRLSIMDKDGHVVDSVEFVVRGAGTPPEAMPEE